MNELQELLKARLSPKIKPKKMQSWQIEALEAVEYFIDGKAKLSSIPKYAKVSSSLENCFTSKGI